MGQKIQAVRGTRALFPKCARHAQHITRVLSDTATRYGFHPIHIPTLEHTELFQRSLGGGSDIVSKEMFTFADKSAKRNSLTLRPEGTAGVVRAVIDEGLIHNLPQKLFYSANMFRYERPQRGRYREFHQFGVELIGSGSPTADVEVISIANDSLKKIGINDSNSQLHLNSIGNFESRSQYHIVLKEFLSKYTNDLSTESQQRLERGSVLRILDSKNKKDQEIVSDAPTLTQYLSKEDLHRFDAVRQGLSDLNINFVWNQNLVRGLDYYSHSVFEFVELSNPSVAILAGGRYDNLVETLGGPSVPAIGWAAGVDRLRLLSPSLADVKIPTIAMVPIVGNGENEKSSSVIQQSFALSNKLRNLGINLHFCYPSESNNSIKKQMKIADKFECGFAVLLGEDEVLNNQVTLKNLSSGSQSTFCLSTEYENFVATIQHGNEE